MSDTKPKLRARDLGIPFDGTPGPLNAITDVAGVEVGHDHAHRRRGQARRRQGPVRTGVTAILPRGKDVDAIRVFAGWFSLNGNGEMTGTAWIEESGFLEGPVMHHQHAQRRRRARRGDRVAAAHGRGARSRGRCRSWPRPGTAFLNDINGFHVKAEHVFAALDGATAARSRRATSAAAPA